MTQLDTLADFKRALNTKGVQLETLSLANHVSGGRLHVGQIRPVISADTTGVYLATEGKSSRGSFLGYGKASEWIFNGDIATNVCGLSYRVLMPVSVGVLA